MEKEITLTESASKQILYLINREEKSHIYFRIRVDGGGCSGFQYNFTFTDQKDEKDLEFIDNDIHLLVDDVSYDLIKGSIVDYESELIGSSFKINNPQATASCGCGTSFSI